MSLQTFLSDQLNWRVPFESPNPGVLSAVAVIDYDEDFSLLWDLLGGDRLESWSGDNTSMLVITGFAPVEAYTSEGAYVYPHLTAFSWAAAWRLLYPESRARVAIVIPPQAEIPHEPQPVPSLVELIEASSPAGVPIVAGIFTFQLSPRLPDEIRAWAAAGNAADTLSPVAANLLQQTLWSGIADPRSDHHSLSNFLGAYVLGQSIPNLQPGTLPDTIERAIERLVATLIRREGANGLSPGALRFWLPEHVAADPAMPLVLIDDMFRVWEPIIEAVCRVDAGRIVSRYSPGVKGNGAGFESIIAALECKGGANSIRNQLFSNAPELREGLVFLDLRLFATPDAEHEFHLYRRLYKIAERISRRKVKYETPWALFSEHELALMRKAIASTQKGNHEGYLLCLTLLPRLLSIHLPLLPISIFSSSAQKDILRSLSGYGNIITDFQKPSFFSGAMVQDVIAGTREGFSRAWTQAGRISAARQAVQNFALGQEVVLLPKLPARSATKPVVWVFIDESGTVVPPNHPKRSGNFSIGAFVLFGRFEDTAHNLSSLLIQNDLVWGFSEQNCTLTARDDDRWEDLIRCQIPETFLPKNAVFDADDHGRNVKNQIEFAKLTENALARVERHLSAAGVMRVAACAFVYDTRTYPAPKGNVLDFSSIIHLDRLYREGLRSVLRFLFADYSPLAAALKAGAVELRVEVAQRELMAKALESPPYRDALERKFAARIRSRKDKKGKKSFAMKTIGGDEVFPLVAGILADLNLPLNCLSGARAVMLNDFESTDISPARLLVEEALPLQLHYLADLVAKFACKPENERPPTINGWFKNGFIEPVNPRFETLWREVDQGARWGKRAEAIRALRNLDLQPENALTNGKSAERYLRERASQWPGELTGLDLRSLFAQF